MPLIGQLDTKLKLYACFALLMCLSTSLSLWLLGQAGATPHRAWAWLCIDAMPAIGAALALRPGLGRVLKA